MGSFKVFSGILLYFVGFFLLLWVGGKRTEHSFFILCFMALCGYNLYVCKPTKIWLCCYGCVFEKFLQHYCIHHSLVFLRYVNMVERLRPRLNVLLKMGRNGLILIPIQDPINIVQSRSKYPTSAEQFFFLII